MNETKQRALAWIDSYGASRKAGASVADTLRLVSLPPPELRQQFAALAQQADATRAARIAEVEARWDALEASVSGIPIVGGLCAAIWDVFGDLEKWIVEQSKGSCSTECRSPVDDEKRDLVGLNPASAIGSHLYVYLLHDGLVVEGTPQQAPYGVVKGVATRLPSGAHQAAPYGGEELLPAGIPMGSRERPWTTPGTIWHRAWRVQSLLQWVEDKVACAIILCWASTLSSYGAVYDVIKQRGGMPAGVGRWTFARLVGSRWLASLYYWQADAWNMARTLGKDKAVGILRSMAFDSAAAELDRCMSGYQYDPKDVEYPWTPFLRKLSFPALRDVLSRFSLEARSQHGTLSSSTQQTLAILRNARGITAESIEEARQTQLEEQALEASRAATERTLTTAGSIAKVALPLAVGGLGLWLATRKG